MTSHWCIASSIAYKMLRLLQVIMTRSLIRTRDRGELHGILSIQVSGITGNTLLLTGSATTELPPAAE
jgi:hypothetical protein